ncbi:transporter substrate-binding domain-containing protein, partial [bacterium]|nr:transporter substrate-binding domain-containing protein [bacterium]
TYASPPFSEIIPGVEEKRFQLGFGSYLRTPEREARVAFSDSIWRSSSRLLARPEIAARLTPQVASPGGEISLETLRAARVTVIGNSQQHRYLQSVAAAQGLTVQSMATMGDCLDALYKEDADFAFLPVLNAYVLLDPNAEKKLAFVGPGMVDNGLGGTVHIALPREDRALRKTVDEALAEMRRDGSYPRIWRQHFPFDFY